MAYPQRDEASETAALRAGLYRRELDELKPAQWLHAVIEAIRTDQWFPTVARLHECADAWRPPFVPALPPSEEEREEARRAAREGLELIRASVREAVAASTEAHVVAKAMPASDTEIVATDERLELLRGQAQEILR